MNPLRELPEVAGLDAGGMRVRIPPELDVPMTPRVRRIVDTAAFRRLGRVSQLGLVAVAYPAANHTRFEHALGVYRLALLFLKQLSYDARFAAAVSVADAELFLATALVHDIGHWPFCHPIEDMHLAGIPRHEDYAQRYLLEGELADVLRSQWRIEPRQVLALLCGELSGPTGQILDSMLSSPVDIDKMDYLARDSLHAGVPYGRHFDQQRLIGSLCLNEAGTGLAIGEKGRTAAEMMVFARYVMFSEVYWHHTVRSATAMLQRAFYLLRERLDFENLFVCGDSEFVTRFRTAAAGGPAEALLEGLFGPKRRLYKRLVQFSFFDERGIYERLARRTYDWLAGASARLAELLSSRLGKVIGPVDVIFDAPPVEREIEFDVQIYFPKDHRYRDFADASPVVRTLAQEQFDDYVKRVRIFANPELVAPLREIGDIRPLVEQVIDMSE